MRRKRRGHALKRRYGHAGGRQYVQGMWWDRKTGTVLHGLGTWVLNASGERDWFWPKGKPFKVPR